MTGVEERLEKLAAEQERTAEAWRKYPANAEEYAANAADLRSILAEREKLRAELALADETLGMYADDEDAFLADEGEPYGSIVTEAGLFARKCRRRHREREAALQPFQKEAERG